MNYPRVGVSALPPRPAKHNHVAPSDYSLGYEDCFDASAVSRLLPSVPPTRLYESIACAHDHRSQLTPDTADPFWTTPGPLKHRPRRISLSKIAKNPPPALVSPSAPNWRPRRSSYEARRGAVGVTPSEVNLLVPYIPPIDTSMPPPSKEWLDAQAKRILAEAHADLENSQRNPTADPSAKPDDDDDWNFDYDSDSTVEGVVTASRPSVPQPAQPTPQPEPESSSHESDDDSSDSDTNTDIDMNSDDGYNWSMTRISESSPLALSDVPRWIIPRKRPSVDVIHVDRSSPCPADNEQPGKRRRGGKWAASWNVKQSKRHADDTPMRQRHEIIVISDSEEDSTPTTHSLPPRTSSTGSDTATSSCPPSSATPSPVLQLKDVPTTPPSTASPAAGILELQSSIASRTPKTFPCHLDGCGQVCASAGDLQRHQQSLRHRAPSHSCLACGKSYTRSDALKRHLNSKASCKREHATKLAAHGERRRQELTEADTEAVSIVL